MADNKESYKFDLGVEGLRIDLPMETKLHVSCVLELCHLDSSLEALLKVYSGINICDQKNLMTCLHFIEKYQLTRQHSAPGFYLICLSNSGRFH